MSFRRRQRTETGDSGMYAPNWMDGGSISEDESEDSLGEDEDDEYTHGNADEFFIFKGDEEAEEENIQRLASIPKAFVHGPSFRDLNKREPSDRGAYLRRASVGTANRMQRVRLEAARRAESVEKIWNNVMLLWRTSQRGVGGGAGSYTVVAILFIPIVPFFFIVKGLNLANFLLIQLFSIPLILYLWASFPKFAAWVFVKTLQNFTPVNNFPLKVGSLSINPHIEHWRLYLHVVVRNFRFGNPKGFPFDSFLSCRRFEFEASLPFDHFYNILLQRKVPCPLEKVPDFQRCAVIDFSHIEADGVMCNFQMYNGKFNITEFTRELAMGETNKTLKGRPHPNQLRVRVIRARNLQAHRLKRSKADAYVVVRVRRQSQSTQTKPHSLSPMWNTELVFEHHDPSVVLEVSVYDRDAPDGSQAYLIGHWAMTSKYLITDPNFCWHNDNQFTVLNSKTGNKFGFRGWVPLASKTWKEMGLRGEVELELNWEHVDPKDIENPYTPLREYTAFEQLTQTSYEDRLRFGDWARFKHWFSHEPYLFDIRRFTVRDIKFYLQDLFRGHQGQLEKVVVNEGAFEDADCVRIPKLEFKSKFRPKNSDPGITCYDVFVNFFAGLGPKFARSGRLGSAVMQVAQGGVLHMGTQVANFFTGKFDRTALPSARASVRRIATKAKSGFEVLHQKHTIMPHNQRNFKRQVTASDSDYLLDTVELTGYLDRCAQPIRKPLLETRELAAYASRRAKFRTKYMELKGNTIFYRKYEDLSKYKGTYSITYKIEIPYISNALFLRSKGELLLSWHDEQHVVRLREPQATRSRGNILKGNPSLEEWFEHLKDRGVPCDVLETIVEEG